jgi:hypothetical protein
MGRSGSLETGLPESYEIHDDRRRSGRILTSYSRKGDNGPAGRPRQPRMRTGNKVSETSRAARPARPARVHRRRAGTIRKRKDAFSAIGAS